MKSSSPLYICTKCDAQFPKWSGRCLECQAWGTVTKEQGTRTKEQGSMNMADPRPLSGVSQEQAPRIKIGIQELDTVLGGGLVTGSLLLLGGEPGIGKSTIALQILQKIAQDKQPLYVSGEESGRQIHMRAKRLDINTENILFLAETNVESICAQMEKQAPPLVIVDSVQTIYSKEVDSEPGNITQVRACTVKLLEAAKKHNTSVILVGHVTKEGHVAGPKTLEHLVDTVLYLEGDRYHRFRLLRTVKNRFGPTNEVGVFEMTSDGLTEVQNPSSLFVSSKEQLAGSVVSSLFEGSRPFLIEIQALVTKSPYAAPQRRTAGYDANRLQLLLAVLEKHTKQSFHQMDVHINITGGMKIKDPATDLAVCAALLTALKETPPPPKTIILGEVGLAGEIRPVKHQQDRLKEAEKLGYKKVIMPDQEVKTQMDMTTVGRIDELVGSL